MRWGHCQSIIMYAYNVLKIQTLWVWQFGFFENSLWRILFGVLFCHAQSTPKFYLWQSQLNLFVVHIHHNHNCFIFNFMCNVPPIRVNCKSIVNWKSLEERERKMKINQSCSGKVNIRHVSPAIILWLVLMMTSFWIPWSTGMSTKCRITTHAISVSFNFKIWD